MHFRTFLTLFVVTATISANAALAGTIDCANSSWNTTTKVVSLKITGLTPGTRVIASVYNDNTCTVRTSVETSPADGSGVVVVAIDTSGTAAVGDKVVISDPGCATLSAGGVVTCGATCPVCPIGACCNTATDDCFQVTDAECKDLGFTFRGAGTPCGTDGKCIPTLSEWGVVVMAMLVLTAGTIVVMRRRAAVA